MILAIGKVLVAIAVAGETAVAPCPALTSAA